MSILRTAAVAATLAHRVARHPAVQAGIMLAPVLLTPEVKAKARDAALSTAYGAGVLARKLVDGTRRR